MTILKTIAHLNELMEETTNDYYLLPDIKDDKPDEIGVFFTYEDEVTVVRVSATPRYSPRMSVPTSIRIPLRSSDFSLQSGIARFHDVE
ncbi:MAG: hypothetical protein LBP72_03495 [Dysgonamonadaceae bacterium]|jgi:hypothetical protein|nr:hypothetical protein [Dysgonamonadaceae bacterium]